MSYTINPDTLSSLLYPVSYRSIEPSAVVQQQVDVYVGGSLAGSFLAAQTGTSGSSAVFDTNIQSFLYSDVAPLTGAKTSFFGTLNAYSLTNNTDVIKSVFCVSKNQTVSSAGFLVTSTASQFSSTGFVIPSQFYGDENNFNLNDFYQPSANPFRFLTTNNQDRRCNDDGNIFLSFVGKGVNAGRFQFYTKSGSSAETIVDFVISSANNNLYSLSVGAANIFGSSAIFHMGNFPASSSAYNYYSVSVGSYDGSYTQHSESIDIFLEPTCNDNIDLHWFGKYGGAESYQFRGLIQDLQNANADIINISQPWNVAASPRANSFDKTIIKTNQRVNKRKQVKCSIPHEDALYIASMFYSPEVYIIENGKYVNVTISNAEILTDNNRTTDIELSFEITYPNKPTAQL
jgi:hypothetical protein